MLKIRAFLNSVEKIGLSTRSSSLWRIWGRIYLQKKVSDAVFYVALIGWDQQYTLPHRPPDQLDRTNCWGYLELTCGVKEACDAVACNGYWAGSCYGKHGATSTLTTISTTGGCIVVYWENMCIPSHGKGSGMNCRYPGSVIKQSNSSIIRAKLACIYSWVMAW